MVQIVKPISYSQTWTFFEGEWHEGNVPIMGPRTHAAWLGSTVFDGARAFEGVAPDLDRHCARVNRSATNFGLKPVVDPDTLLGLARDGIKRFAPNAELYIRPMYWAQHGAGGGVLFDLETTNWCISLYEAPMPAPSGNAITLSPFRRPTMECAPVDAKAACLYPNNSRALVEAVSRGFNNCLMLDMLDLRAADLDDVLARHRAHPAVCGIRQEAWFDPQSTRADIPRVNLLTDPAWRAGLARLAVHGLSFDLLVWPHQLVHAAEIFAALPELAVVVEHTGLPPLDDPAGMQLWRDGLARFAATVPHAVLKISAMAFIASGWTTEVVGPIVREALEIFGPQRCMLGSNFPVDRGAASYADIWSGYEQITADLSDAERTALFSGTALRTYRIDIAS